MGMKIIALAAALLLSGAAHAEATLRLAVTTSLHNSGLADALLPAIRADLDLEIQLVVVGTGQALRLGAAGDVDAVIVHARAAEEAFVAAGHATHRRPFMHNDFIFLGPSEDPAGARAARTAADALARIAGAQAPFVSRGDDSGTHKKELSLWAAAAHNPTDFGPWYKEIGAGMGAALNMASGMDAYLLSDRASWFNFGNKGDLELLFAGDPALLNQYAFLPINPARHEHLRHDLALDLERWLVSDRAKILIEGHKINGETLFIFDADQSAD